MPNLVKTKPRNWHAQSVQLTPEQVEALDRFAAAWDEFSGSRAAVIRRAVDEYIVAHGDEIERERDTAVA